MPPRRLNLLSAAFPPCSARPQRRRRDDHAAGGEAEAGHLGLRLAVARRSQEAAAQPGQPGGGRGRRRRQLRQARQDHEEQVKEATTLHVPKECQNSPASGQGELRLLGITFIMPNSGMDCAFGNWSGTRKLFIRRTTRRKPLPQIQSTQKPRVQFTSDELTALAGSFQSGVNSSFFAS